MPAKRRPRSLRDPAEMKALAHPTRIALLETLGVYGPMTATEAATHVGESPSSCSYHLRQLARYGYVEETGTGTGRQRPWRRLDLGLDIGQPSEPASKLAADALASLFLDRYLGRVQTAMASRDAQPVRWRRAVSFSESVLWLTPAEVKAMNAEIVALLMRHNDRLTDPALRPDGSRPVEMLHFSYLLPESPSAPT